MMSRHRRTHTSATIVLLLAVFAGCADALNELDNPAVPGGRRDGGVSADGAVDSDAG